jgi:hypothetical protein
MSVSPVEIRIYTEREKENTAECITSRALNAERCSTAVCSIDNGQYIITFIQKRIHAVRDSHCVRARHKEIQDTVC